MKQSILNNFDHSVKPNESTNRPTDSPPRSRDATDYLFVLIIFHKNLVRLNLF